MRKVAVKEHESESLIPEDANFIILAKTYLACAVMNTSSSKP